MAFLNRNYSGAVDLDKIYLENTKSKGGGTIRHVLESVTRCYICLNDFDKANLYCDKLLKVVHLVNVFQLQMTLARIQNYWSKQTWSLICQLLNIHPWLDRFWLLLAHWNRVNNNDVKENWCLEKASETQESVNLPDVDSLKAHHKLSCDQKTQIADKVLRDISVPKQSRSDNEFVDLGSLS